MLAIQLNVHTNFQPMRVALRSSRIRSSCRQPLLFNTRSLLLFAPAGRSPAATRTLASLQQAQQAIDSDAMDRDEKEQQPQLRKLEELRFDNLALRALPVEDGPRTTPRPVPGACFSRAEIQPLAAPRVVAVSDEALALIGLDPSEAEARPDAFAAFFGGCQALPGAEPAAHCYCGHQFGSFAGQLGDGAAMYLGEAVNPKGERWELQLKGAGRTPYSRAADGRKVLRSSLREFLCSEAMAALGIPTTRAASLVTSDSRVERDPLYDGRAVMERASVVSRVAPTFLRFGSFEICKPPDASTGRAGPSAGREAELLPRLLDYAVRTHFPELWAAHGGPPGLEGGPEISPQQRADIAADWFAEVCRRTARLVAAWQGVGFVHGVLNTDNMSILGLTIDYGPFGFLDRYDPDHVSNGSDDAGRYAYSAQPEICRWNCETLGAALGGGGLLAPAKARAGLAAYDREYAAAYRGLMRRKLGLCARDEGADDDALLESLLETMAATGADWTNAWRRLAAFPMDAASNEAVAAAAAAPAPAGSGAAAGADAAAKREAEAAAGKEEEGGAAAAASSTSASAAVEEAGGFLAATLAELATAEEMARGAASRIPDANLQMLSYLAARDPSVLHQLGVTPDFIKREAARAQAAAKWRGTPAADKAAADDKAWRAWLRRYASRLAREAAAGATDAERVRVMRAASPRLVLRNYAAEEAIRAAEAGDFQPARRLLALLQHPYAEAGELPAALQARGDGGAAPAGGGAPEPAASAAVCPLRLAGRPPAWAQDLCVTCSS